MITEVYGIDGRLEAQFIPSKEYCLKMKLAAVASKRDALIEHLEGPGDANLKKVARLARAGDTSAQTALDEAVAQVVSKGNAAELAVTALKTAEQIASFDVDQAFK